MNAPHKKSPATNQNKNPVQAHDKHKKDKSAVIPDAPVHNTAGAKMPDTSQKTSVMEKENAKGAFAKS